MTASLYQSARSSLRRSSSISFLSSDNTEHVRRQGLRVELDEVAPPRPAVVAAAEQVVDDVSAVLSPVEIDPARLHVARIEVHRHQDPVLARLLGIDEQLVVVGRMEAQAPVALQRRVLLPDLVQPRDERSEAVGPV